MRKFQQYYIFKFQSSRLKRAKYNVDLTIQDARKNAELVSVGDSQLLRTIRDFDNRGDIDGSIGDLTDEKGRIKNRKSNSANIKRLKQLDAQLDNLLFVPQIIAIVVDDNRHYQNIINKGLVINGQHYVRILCGAGNARRNTVIFIDKSYYRKVARVLNNGFNPSTKIVPAKYNAYFALCSSATIPVSNLKFCVIPDHVVTRKERVDMVMDATFEDKIATIDTDIEFNLFDGMGLISPAGAEVWSDELELKYIPSSFVVRNSFLKGMVCVFDFHRFAKESSRFLIKDIWGNNVNIHDVDMIVTESQFKTWNNYASLLDYQNHCSANKMHWGISRYAPEHDKTHTFSNYQFLQVLEADSCSVENLCKDTIDYFEKTISGDIGYTLLYLLGKHSLEEHDPLLYHKVHDNVLKALLLNNDLLEDAYVKSHILSTLNKKIKESYIGNLVMRGNYSTMIADPYALAQHALGMVPIGLLRRGQSYSNFWNCRNVNKVVACRAPLTWKSEVNVLNFESNYELQKWYQYISSGIIYNVHGTDTMLHADSDMDGDIVMTTNNADMIAGASLGLPITYPTHPVEKTIIDDDLLYKADMLAFNTKIGFITNISTTLYAMLPLYPVDSAEHLEIIKRLKLCRKEQGLQIDKAKGLVVKPFPKHWTSWNKVEDGVISQSDCMFYNKILVDKRPYFMRYLYPAYNKKYKRFIKNYYVYAATHFGQPLEEIVSGDADDDDKKIFLHKYHRYQPLIDTDCIINEICHCMEKRVGLLKVNTSKRTPDYVVALMKDGNIKFDTDKFKNLYDLYKKYKSEKRNFSDLKKMDGSDKYKTLEQYYKSILSEAYSISSNICELANLAVTICYEAHPLDNHSFAWNVFGEGIVKNVSKNRQTQTVAPFRRDNGKLEYLGEKYDMLEIIIPGEDEVE